jgi:methyl-accepting chemotaxis protein
MNPNNGALAVIANRSIATKVSAGFACVLAIFAIVSGIAYLSFQTSAEGFANYVQRVSVVAIARDVDRSFLNLRRLAREYASLGIESSAEAANKEQALLRSLLQQGLTEIKNSDRHRLLEDVVRSFEAYSTGFSQFVAQSREQKKLVEETLDPLGAGLQQHFDELIAAAAKAGNGSVGVLAYEGRQHLMVARLNTNKLLGRHEQAAGEAADKSFANLTVSMRALDAATKDAEFRKTFDDLQAGLRSYQGSYRKAVDIERTATTLANTTLRDMGQRLVADTESIKASGIVEEKQEEHDTLTTMAWTSSLILYLSIGGLLVGAVLAWLIGRGIAGPVVRMCVAMRVLAGGDKTVEIPGVGRKDEIGQMADTVAVFKSNMVEADRLRAETERHKAEVEAARKSGMLKLADNFEAGIKGVVNSVASQATEMQSSAEAMTHTAEQATTQATAVAASVEEASANVQTVASSAEELSTSVLEIGRQVEQSSKIAGQAVVEADKTNATVEGLNKTAQRIGEVVQLIETIASQTTAGSHSQNADVEPGAIYPYNTHVLMELT